ncbi:Tn7 transposase TnsA N-terminal domain-containing protein [Azospirillum sp. sgz302134]
MSTRNIRPTSSSVTGTVQSACGIGPLHFESTLERDLLILLDFHPATVSIETQPVTIEYEHEGKRHRYTPDVLARFHPSRTMPCGTHQRVLFEVKYAADLRRKWTDLRPKFSAAKTWALAHGMVFHVITEQRIRTPLLANANLLNRARQLGAERSESLIGAIHDCLEAGPQPIRLLLALGLGEPWLVRKHIHHIMRIDWLRADLTVPLTDDTVVRNWWTDV